MKKLYSLCIIVKTFDAPSKKLCQENRKHKPSPVFGAPINKIIQTMGLHFSYLAPPSIALA